VNKVVNVRTEKADIYIGRGSKWGNPFFIGKDGNRDDVVVKYKTYILSRPDLIASLPELKNKSLGCYCAPLRCHGDVLAELVREIA